MERRNLLVFLSVVVAMLLIPTTSAATYTVGGTTGWANPGGAATYTTWAAQYNFVVGDILVFNFVTGSHTVANVTQSAFDSCNTANPLSIQNTGPATITITTAGENYFICTVNNHCSNGQKLSINATTTAASSPPSGSPPTTPSGTPSPPSPPSPRSPPPPPPSTAPGTAVGTFSLILISFGIALLGYN